jgi:hypothetical protein
MIIEGLLFSTHRNDNTCKISISTYKQLRGHNIHLYFYNISKLFFKAVERLRHFVIQWLFDHDLWDT